jgi:hypothetical protein
MKPALLVLLCICAAVSVAPALPAIPLPIHHGPEIDWATASSALIVLSGVIGIIRGYRLVTAGLDAPTPAPHHVYVLVLPHIKRLGDCFGQFLVRVVCDWERAARSSRRHSSAWSAGK